MKEIDVTIGSRQFPGKTVGSLGVTFTMTELPGYSAFESLKWGTYLTNRYIFNIVYAFKGIFIQQNFSNIGGPLIVISETIKGARKGIKIFLLYLAILSINLAILNLLPLPILDGGQIMFHTIEAIIRRPIPNRIREYIHIASWIAFLFLLVYLSMKDIARLGESYFKTFIQTLRNK
jgi:RIP metalloprotease RseP